MSFKIYHNPRCSKSRQALNLLISHNIEPEIVEYLKTPLSESEIRSLLDMLKISAFDLIRKGEEEYKTLFKGKSLSEDEWIQAMVDYPKLIERPIVVKNKKAILGRPLEKVIDLLK
jgi:arsenate reductase